ncbi:hypothetical protein, partial [Kribbella sp. NPDC003557]|uniref:hypothetical protein n=1 Tax=Kribbella sp. NPDC003557 TaxID=3154449 RepID=UPI0033B5A5D7
RDSSKNHAVTAPTSTPGPATTTSYTTLLDATTIERMICMRGLLAQVVATRQLQPEPVATDALVHLLGYSRGARAALGNLLSELCPGASIGPLTYTGQMVAEADPGRPDIVGEDASSIRIVIEAKFDAELTAAQLGQSYLDRLPVNQPGRSCSWHRETDCLRCGHAC